MAERADIRWLFERNVFNDGNPRQMAEIVRSKRMEVVEATYECVEGDEARLRSTAAVPFSHDEKVFVYGSMNLCRWLLRQGRWPKLTWYDFERLRCQSYYAHWGQFLLQQLYVFLPLAEVQRRRSWLFRTLGRDGRIFVRPDDNAKSFSGGMVEEANFERWWELAKFYHPGPACMAVVAQPRVIYAEWRLVIRGKRVVTASQYRCDGAENVSAGCPPDAAAFAETIARSGDFDPHPMYVMDVCQTDDGLRLVEIGSVCCALLYACDVEQVIEAVADVGGGNG